MATNISPAEKIKKLIHEFKKSNPATHEINELDENDHDVQQLLLAFGQISTQLEDKIQYQSNDLYQVMSSALLGDLVASKPSCTMVQFTPFDDFSAPVLVKKGMKISEEGDIDEGGNPIGGGVGGKMISYSTCYNFTLYPYRKVSAAALNRNKQISFKIENLSKKPAELNIVSLPLSFVNQTSSAESAKMFMAFMSNLEYCVIKSESNPRLSARIEADELVRPIHDAKHGMFKASKTDSEMELWLTYFLLPEKLQYLHLNVARASHIFRQPGNIIIEFHLPDNNLSFSVEDLTSIRINCVACINLFKEHSFSQKIDHKNPVVVLQSKEFSPIHSVFKVFGIFPDNTKRNYVDLNKATIFGKGASLAYAARLADRSKGIASDAAIELAWGIGTDVRSDEILTAIFMCTDGKHDLKRGLTKPVLKSGEPHFSVESVGRKSTYIPGLASDEKMRLVMEKRSISRFNLQTAIELRHYLQHVSYLVSSKENFQEMGKVIEALKKVTISDNSFLYDGRMLHGQNIEIIFDNSGFDVGNLYMLGYLINKLYGSFTPFNYFSRVTLNNMHGVRLFKYPVVLGNKIIRI